MRWTVLGRMTLDCSFARESMVLNPLKLGLVRLLLFTLTALLAKLFSGDISRHELSCGGLRSPPGSPLSRFALVWRKACCRSRLGSYLLRLSKHIITG
jgi:hypothetical protein